MNTRSWRDGCWKFYHRGSKAERWWSPMEKNFSANRFFWYNFSSCFSYYKSYKNFFFGQVDSDEDGKIDLYHQTKSASLKVKNRALQLQSLQSTQMEEPVISTGNFLIIFQLTSYLPPFIYWVESDGSNLQRRQKVKLASTSSNEKERTQRPKLKNTKEETLSLGIFSNLLHFMIYIYKFLTSRKRWRWPT